jgi:hypothetical protein
MDDPSDLKVALACGAAGAYVDVTDYLRGNEPVTVSPGRTSGFEDTAPQVAAFTLDNSDGRFTPDNSGSSLSVTVTEGMGVCMQIDSKLYAGAISSITPFFRSTLGSSAQMRISFDDMLGKASRNEIGSLADGINQGATTYLLWELSEQAGDGQAAEQNHNPFGSLVLGSRLGSAFGFEIADGLATTGASLAGNTTGLDILAGINSGGTQFPYPTSSMGHWGVWLIPKQSSGLGVALRFNGLDAPIQFGIDINGNYFVAAGDGALTQYAAPSFGTAHFLSIGVGTVFTAGAWVITTTLYVDGTAQAVASTRAQPPATSP